MSKVYYQTTYSSAQCNAIYILFFLMGWRKKPAPNGFYWIKVNLKKTKRLETDFFLKLLSFLLTCSLTEDLIYLVRNKLERMNEWNPVHDRLLFLYGVFINRCSTILGWYCQEISNIVIVFCMRHPFIKKNQNKTKKNYFTYSH